VKFAIPLLHRYMAAPASIHADRSHGRTYIAADGGNCFRDFHRSRVIRDHLKQTTLTDVILRCQPLADRSRRILRLDYTLMRSSSGASPVFAASCSARMSARSCFGRRRLAWKSIDPQLRTLRRRLQIATPARVRNAPPPYPAKLPNRVLLHFVD
jgi:hypothetical protein